MLSRAKELHLSVFNDEGRSTFPLAPVEVLLTRTVRLQSALMLEVLAVIGATTVFAGRCYTLLLIFLLVSSLLDHFGLFNR